MSIEVFNAFHKYFVSVFFIANSLILLGGCASLKGEAPWGKHAFSGKELAKVRSAFTNAASDSNTWLPIVGAVTLQTGNMDKQISDWARRDKPIFGSTHNARIQSDILRDTGRYSLIATTLLTPSGTSFQEITLNKFRGMGAEILAIESVSGITSALKESARRERPDSSNTRSFPSAHTSAAMSYATLNRRNIARLPISKKAKRYSVIAFNSLAIGTAWGRVEGGAHYPSDVFIGAALGNFLTNFFYDIFLEKYDKRHINIVVTREQNNTHVGASVAF